MYGDSAGAHSYDDNDEYGYDEEEIDYAMRGMSMQDSHNRQVKIVHGAIARCAKASIALTQRILVCTNAGDGRPVGWDGIASSVCEQELHVYKHAGSIPRWQPTRAPVTLLCISDYCARHGFVQPILMVVRASRR